MVLYVTFTFEQIVQTFEQIVQVSRTGVLLRRIPGNTLEISSGTFSNPVWPFGRLGFRTPLVLSFICCSMLVLFGGLGTGLGSTGRISPLAVHLSWLREVPECQYIEELRTSYYNASEYNGNPSK